MSNILAVTSDRYAVITPSPLAVQSDNLTPLTVTFDAAAIALFGANPVFRIDWQLADGTDLYSGNHAVVASTDLAIPDSVLAQAGALHYQIRVSDDAGLVWHSLTGYTILPEAIEAATPATAQDASYVKLPTVTPAATELLVYDSETKRAAGSGKTTADFASGSLKVKQTADGGTAILLTNRTGAPSVKGYVVRASPTYDNAVALIIKDQPDPIGVFLDSGVADGAETWVVTGGIADVYFVGNTTRGQIARGFLTADGAGYVPGQAMAENVPGSPFATDKHFYECGHVLESRTGAGLAKCVLHFN